MSHPQPKRNPALALTLLALVLAGPLFANEPPTSDRGRTVLKTAAHIMVSDLRSSLELLDVEAAFHEDQNTVVLRGHEDGDLDTALELIDALDQPSPTLEIQAFVLTASRKEPSGGSIVEEIEPVAEKLRDLFGFRSFDQIDSVFLSVLEGHPARAEGSVKLSDGRSAHYGFGFQQVRVTPREDGRLFVRLVGMEFEMVDRAAQRPLAALRTDLEILAGQKAVVGKSTPEGFEDSLVLVLQAAIR